MANRYAEEIRRIVGVDNLAGGIGAQTPKQPIVGGRGIAYFNADGSIGSASGTKGETTPPEDAADGNAVTDGDGNTGDDITHEPVSDSGVVPVEDLFNGNMGIGDSFTGVNGLQDCATGQEYEVRGDGQFNAPEGWGEVSTVYHVDKPSFNDDWFTSAEAACSNYVEGIGYQDAQVIGSGCYGKAGEHFTLSWLAGIDGYACSDVSHAPAAQAVCSPTEWPAETPAQLTWDSETSSFITSQYDGNVASQYKSNNAGQVSLCDSLGNQYTVVPSKDGGLVFTDVTKNIFIVRGSNGKITAAGTGSNRDQYVAK